MLLHAYYPGDARVKREARTLAARYDVRVLYLCGREDDVAREYRDGDVTVQSIQVTTRYLPRSPVFWLIKYLEFIVRCAIATARSGADVYHAHDLPMMIPARLAALVRSRPIVYDSHELFADMEQHSPARAKAWRAIDRWAVRAAARVIAVNRSRADVMMEELGSPEPVIIPNLPLPRTGPDLDPAASPLRAFARERTGRDDATILLYQGMLGPGRALDRVVRAMALSESGAIFVVLGFHNDYVDELLALARELGIEERVHYHPGVDSDQLPAITVGADAGLVIYAKTPRNNYLCAPNKLFDYCMAGIPIVGCDFPEVRRVADEYPIGELFDVDSPESIAGAIDRLLGDPAKLEEAQRATRVVREKYHWGVAQAALEGLYEQILPASS